MGKKKEEKRTKDRRRAYALRHRSPATGDCNLCNVDAAFVSCTDNTNPWK